MRQSNLQRLFAPRHIAAIGGRDAAAAIAECDRIGFKGAIWPVNPTRETLGGRPCFRQVEDLPAAPDAVFLAVPAPAVIDTVRQLQGLGVGGIVCYTAGFGETGDTGRQSEQELVAAAGDTALIGPNCYGMINYVDKVALWPFTHGGDYPGYGAAIITQSGMLSSDICMSQRSIPLACMVSAGNQAVLGSEDYLEFLCEKPQVRAIGLHIEGIRDIHRFSAAALKALACGKPIVALKTGSSKLGSQLTISHTGTLSRDDDLYNALFDRLGIVRVLYPAQLLETLKLCCVTGPPAGNRIAAFTCSGGGATLIADDAEKLDLVLAEPTATTVAELETLLPDIATVSNPLDYTTPIWGQRDRVEAVMQAVLADECDLAVIVQDYPPPGLDESKPSYLNDAKAFIAATQARQRRGIACSTFSESIDRETRHFFIENGIAPMQGLQETMTAIASGVWYTRRRGAILADRPAALCGGIEPRDTFPLDEHAAKQCLEAAGIAVPPGKTGNAADVPALAATIGFPVALKMLSPGLAHKTEAGAVRTGLSTPEAVAAAVAVMQRDVKKFRPESVADAFLVERMIESPIAELMVGVRSDPGFGLAMTLAGGGIFVELIGDAATLLLPCRRRDILDTLGRLKVSALLDGFRGRPAANRQRLADTLLALAHWAEAERDRIAELEINPLLIGEDTAWAVDALIRCWR